MTKVARTGGPELGASTSIGFAVFDLVNGSMLRLNFFFLTGLPEPKSVTCLDFLAPVVSLALIKPVTAVAADAGAAAAYYIC